MSGWNDQFRDPALIPVNVLRMMPEAERRRIGKAGMLPEERQAELETRTEKNLQNQIANYLRQHDIFFGCQRMDRRSNIVVGWPDFWFVFRGVPIALEAKVGNRKQEPAQLAAQIRMERDGWRYCVVRSVEEVKAILDETIAITKGASFCTSP